MELLLKRWANILCIISYNTCIESLLVFLKMRYLFETHFQYSIISMLISMNYNIKNGIYETRRLFKSPFRSWLSTIWCLKWMPVTIRFQVNEMCGVLFNIEILTFYLQITACICVILQIYKSLSYLSIRKFIL